MTEDFEHEVLQRLTRIETILTEDHKVLRGNGQPGLVDKFAELENRIENIEEENARHGKLMSSSTVIIGFLITTAISLVALFRKG